MKNKIRFMVKARYFLYALLPLCFFAILYIIGVEEQGWDINDWSWDLKICVIPIAVMMFFTGLLIAWMIKITQKKRRDMETQIEKELEMVYDECTKLYSENGVTAVCDHVVKQQDENNPMYEAVTYKHCTPCDTRQPVLNGICLVCGSLI